MNKYLPGTILLLAALAVSILPPAIAQTGKIVNVASCSQADVQAAIDSAADGDSVVVPAGSCAWDTTITHNPSVSINKSIILAGAGIGQTIIIDKTAGGYNEEPIVVSNSGVNNFRITGFTFTGMQKRSASEPAIKTCGAGWRIDHNKFFPDAAAVDSGGRGIMAYGIGLVDHNVFQDTGQGITVRGDKTISWAQALALGTTYAVFVEDNIFNYSDNLDGALDAYEGASFVFRYNTLTGTGLGHHGRDNDANAGTHSFEIYENTFYSAYPLSRAWHSRGGTGVVYNNRLSGNIGQSMPLYDYRTSTDSVYYKNNGRCDGNNPIDGNSAAADGSSTHNGGNNAAALIDTTKNWVTNQWAGYYLWNTTYNSRCLITANSAATAACSLCAPWTFTGAPAYAYSCSYIPGIYNWNNGDAYKITNGYPCADQVGRTSDMNEDGIQDAEPTYAWNNFWCSNDAPLSVCTGRIELNLITATTMPSAAPSMSDHIKEGRDYFNNTVRPNYTPYAYPHPMAAAGAPGNSVPLAPAGLKIRN